MYLVISWAIIALVLLKGVRSSGKASYFLALFPYVIMIVLLGRAVTLPGAGAGILYFIRPQWDKILEPKVGALFYVTHILHILFTVVECCYFFASRMSTLHASFAACIKINATARRRVVRYKTR